MLAFCSTRRMDMPCSRLMRPMISKMSLTSLGEKHHLGPGHEGAADGEHLLLASGQRARALLGPAPEDGEVVIDHLEVAADPLHVLPRVRAHLEVLAHGEEGKDL